MLPDFETFRKSYMKFALFALFGFAWLMTFSLIRNNPNLNIFTLTIGFTVIFSVFIWNMMRDNRSYWTYTFLTLRIWESFTVNQTEIDEVLNSRNRWIYEKHLAALFVSLRVGLVTASCAWIVNFISPDSLPYLALILGGLVFPLFMAWMLKHAITCNLFLMLQAQQSSTVQRVAPFSLWRLVIEDTISTCLITLVLVLPIYQKPEFSLANGYLAPEFVIGFIFLQVIVLFFILLFANRTRRVNLLGDLLNHALVDKALVPSQNRVARLFDWFLIHTSLFNKGFVPRLLIYACWLAIWAVLSCAISAAVMPETQPLITADDSASTAVFTRLWPFVQFTVVYLLGFCASLFIFMLERYHSLTRNLNEAKEMLVRHQFYQARFKKMESQ